MPDRQYYVYMLRCGDGSLYTGYTSNLERRLALHRAGRGAKYTRSRLPLSLAAYWLTAERAEAMRLENALKRLTRQNKLALLSHEAVARVLDCLPSAPLESS